MQPIVFAANYAVDNIKREVAKEALLRNTGVALGVGLGALTAASQWSSARAQSKADVRSLEAQRRQAIANAIMQMGDMSRSAQRAASLTQAGAEQATNIRSVANDIAGSAGRQTARIEIDRDRQVAAIDDAIEKAKDSAKPDWFSVASLAVGTAIPMVGLGLSGIQMARQMNIENQRQAQVRRIGEAQQALLDQRESEFDARLKYYEAQTRGAVSMLGHYTDVFGQLVNAVSRFGGQG